MTCHTLWYLMKMEIIKTYCNEIDRVIVRAKVRVLKCITVVFECNARTSSMTKRRLYGE